MCGFNKSIYPLNKTFLLINKPKKCVQKKCGRLDFKTTKKMFSFVDRVVPRMKTRIKRVSESQRMVKSLSNFSKKIPNYPIEECSNRATTKQ
jgi:hypothetical protein